MTALSADSPKLNHMTRNLWLVSELNERFTDTRGMRHFFRTMLVLYFLFTDPANHPHLVAL